MDKIPSQNTPEMEAEAPVQLGRDFSQKMGLATCNP